jgi:hypothetical protein
MMHLIAWYESIDPAGALSPIAAVNDIVCFTSGDDIRVPEKLTNIIAQACLMNDASLVMGEIQSPSLRAFANLDVEPCIQALVFGSPTEVLFHPDIPIPVAPAESLQFLVNSNPAAAVVHYGLVILADGAQQPVTGAMYSVRATSAITLAAGVWVNGALTFGQTLPVGRYGVVGFRARGTNLVAARLVFSDQANRPGVPAVNAISDQDVSWFRYGRTGVFGTFHTTAPPSIDALGVTDTSQVYQLDLIRVS